ncbi:MAG: M56 family metallopeptidase [Clostridia bacterium]|nr:M56 family metallopeptidase [Clostridia bacterium]
MSFTASILVLFILVLRQLMKKAPKWVSVLLWGFAAIRLICPFGIESSLSLMPKTDWILKNYHQTAPAADLSEFAENLRTEVFGMAGRPDTSAFVPGKIISRTDIFEKFAALWLVGISAMLAYLAVSYIRIYRRTRSAELFRENIYISGNVVSPFVIGVIKPRICLPECMDAVSMSYVISHEEAHIRRKDHWWKLLGFFLLTLHWFNPLIWLAYILFCRDMELACDERVVKDFSAVQRGDYSEVLLRCSVKRSMITACPLAFSEVGVKQRVRSVLNYKKPAYWIVALAVLICIAAAVCFLTDRPTGEAAHADSSTELLCTVESDNADPTDLLALYCPQTYDYSYDELPEAAYRDVFGSIRIRLVGRDDVPKACRVSENYYHALSNEATRVEKMTVTLFREKDGSYSLPLTHRNPKMSEKAVYYVTLDGKRWMFCIQYPSITGDEMSALSLEQIQTLP